MIFFPRVKTVYIKKLTTRKSPPPVLRIPQCQFHPWIHRNAHCCVL